MAPWLLHPGLASFDTPQILAAYLSLYDHHENDRFGIWPTPYTCLSPFTDHVCGPGPDSKVTTNWSITSHYLESRRKRAILRSVHSCPATSTEKIRRIDYKETLCRCPMRVWSCSIRAMLEGLRDVTAGDSIDRQNVRKCA